MKRILMLLFSAMAIVFLGSMTLHAETLAVSSTSGAPGDTVTVYVTLDDNTDGVAGASFTIVPDTGLTLSEVRSDFFPTFLSQGLDESVVVGTDTYYKALVANLGASMIAAARVDNGPTGSQVIFELDFAIDGAATPGTYGVAITASNINNTDAGYPSGGEDIPMLVGIGVDGTSYPEREVTSNTPGTITVTAGIVDTDGDGIDDDWENTHFGNLTTADETTDYDHDGYSDLVEYQNDGTNDLSGLAYNPTVFNVPGGTGYDPATDRYVRNDFDKDGKTDILLRRNTDGLMYNYLMDGNTIKEGNIISALDNTIWLNFSGGDFDGSNSSDILLRRISDGLIYIWHMDGSTIEDDGSIAKLSADWDDSGCWRF